MSKHKIKNDSYYKVEGWMRSELNLKGNELDIYAIIYSFSKEPDCWYTGSQSYIAEWRGISRERANIILHNLIDKKLIEERKVSYGRGLICDYRVTPVKYML